MPYALIENGVVAQLWLPENPPEGYIECGGEVQPGYTYDGETFTPPELESVDEPLPAPSVLVMSTSNVRVSGEEVSVTGGGYNFGGAFREGAGMFLLFTLKPLDGDLFDPWFSVSGGFTLKATVVDPYMVTIEAKDINGELADPEYFSMRIYQP